MPRAYWSLLIGLAIVIVGVFLGVTSLLLLPIVGVFLLIAILFWLAERKTRDEPPVD